MPRTKRPVKKTEKAIESGEHGDVLKILNKIGTSLALFSKFFPPEMKPIQFPGDIKRTYIDGDPINPALICFVFQHFSTPCMQIFKIEINC